MRVQTEAPENVLKAPANGDLLRVLRSVHPQEGILNRIVDAEAAVAESSRLLENAAREHHTNLTRLNVLRSRAGLTTTDVPSVEQLAAVSVHIKLIGRVIQRENLTQLTKTSGILAVDGERIPWMASANYVDALEPLFDGVPIAVSGVMKDGGILSIQEVKPAPRDMWEVHEADAYTRLYRYGQSTVIRIKNLKKILMGQHDHRCQACGYGFPKAAQAAIAEQADGTHTLLCRPCKEDWKAAGRPALTVAEVA